MILKTAVYAASLSFVICVIVYLFIGGGSILEYLAHPIWNSILVCFLLLPFWYKSNKKGVLKGWWILVNVLIAAAISYVISIVVLTLFLVGAEMIYGPHRD
jgi:hypothetical protein